MEPQSTSDYFCIFLRLSNFYFCMMIVQICLAFTIIVGLMIGWSQLIPLIQIWIAFFFSLDLIIKYFSEQKIFWTKIENRIDMTILLIICLSIVADLTYPEEIHHQNTLIGAFVMILRYILQLYRVASLIKASSQLRQHHESKISIKEEVEAEEMNHE